MLLFVTVAAAAAFLVRTMTLWRTLFADRGALKLAARLLAA